MNELTQKVTTVESNSADQRKVIDRELNNVKQNAIEMLI